MKKFILAALVLAPTLAFAQSGNELGNIERLLKAVGRLVNLALPIVVGIALLGFFWGLAKFVFSAGEGKEDGKKIMIWGVIALFVMVSVWGLVSFVGTALGIDQRNTPNSIPTVPGLK